MTKFNVKVKRQNILANCRVLGRNFETSNSFNFHFNGGISVQKFAEVEFRNWNNTRDVFHTD